MLVPALALALVLGQTPVPQPFPRPASPQPARPDQPAPTPAKPAAPAVQPPQREPSAAEQSPTEAALGVPIYPSAQFVGSYDAGRDQRYYIFGVGAPFTDVAAYYRTVLKQKGELVYDAPATLAFDVGKYREETMAFPPGVTVKEYKSEISEGYPNPVPGKQPARFPTLIQIVPVVKER